MSILGTLRRDGCATSPWHLSFRQALEVDEWLRDKGTYDAHCRVYSDQVQRPVHESCWKSGVASYDMADIVNAPHLLRFALKHVPIAAEYLGQEPLLYSCNAFVTVPTTVPVKGGIQGWHRDNDDKKFLALFILGSDVSRPEFGAHEYQKGSHLIPGDDDLGYPHHSPPPDVIQTFTGGPGQAFLIDPRGHHKGRIPHEHPRILYWARFGVTDPATVGKMEHSFNWDELASFGAPHHLNDRSILEDETTRRIVRLVAR